jgi:hypothetical protein
MPSSVSMPVVVEQVVLDDQVPVAVEQRACRPGPAR